MENQVKVTDLLFEGSLACFPPRPCHTLFPWESIALEWINLHIRPLSLKTLEEETFSIIFFILQHPLAQSRYQKHLGDFPGGPVAKILRSQCRGLGFSPPSGN